jgi:hypothetical protein
VNWLKHKGLKDLKKWPHYCYYGQDWYQNEPNYKLEVVPAPSC